MILPQKIRLPIRLGSRASPLAIRQAQIVAEKIRQTYQLDEQSLKLVPIKTKGDKMPDAIITKIGSKRQGVFVRELENALLQDRIDIAVHSLKDMPSILESELSIVAVMPRDDPRDSLICKTASSIETLPQNALLGTSSVRRACQVKRYRSDINIVPLRGNIETRLNAVMQGKIHATFLAKAGLDRLKIKCQYANHISIKKMLPAAAQAIIAIEIKSDNQQLEEMLQPINHHITMSCAIAERAFLAALGGGCSLPVAAYAQVNEQKITLQAEIYAQKFNKQYKVKDTQKQKYAQQLGEKLAKQIIEISEGKF